jgi:hypothetical protein
LYILCLYNLLLKQINSHLLQRIALNISSFSQEFYTKSENEMKYTYVYQFEICTHFVFCSWMSWYWKYSRHHIKWTLLYSYLIRNNVDMTAVVLQRLTDVPWCKYVGIFMCLLISTNTVMSRILRMLSS